MYSINLADHVKCDSKYCIIDVATNYDYCNRCKKCVYHTTFHCSNCDTCVMMIT